MVSSVAAALTDQRIVFAMSGVGIAPAALIRSSNGDVRQTQQLTQIIGGDYFLPPGLSTSGAVALPFGIGPPVSPRPL